MRKNSSKYFHPDETWPISIDKLSKASQNYQIAVMKNWFFRYFENPVENCPFDSSEGGYSYIWGGPYDARDELESQFSGITSQESIDALVNELDLECIDWSGK